jgi:hypothetical protein
MTVYQLARPNIPRGPHLQILHPSLPTDVSSLAVQIVVYKYLYLKLLTVAVPAGKLHDNEEQLPPAHGAIESPVPIP